MQTPRQVLSGPANSEGNAVDDLVLVSDEVFQFQLYAFYSFVVWRGPRHRCSSRAVEISIIFDCTLARISQLFDYNSVDVFVEFYAPVCPIHHELE